MRKAFYIVVTIIVHGMFFSESYAAVVEVSRVTVQGLKYVGKHEIIQHGIYVKDGKIFVDVNSLHGALQNNIMIESYSVSLENNVCTIRIKERDIIAVLLVDKGNSLFVIEVDHNLKILSTGRVYAYDRPIIKINQAEIIDNKLSPRIINILMILKKIINSNSAVASRISVINCMKPEVSYVQFHGFTSKCIWDETYNGLTLLDAVIGLYDSKRAYPENAVVTQKRMVVW
ncbi:MAG: hypothetical protein N3F66_03065 [Spirochaetes bacterium]|nr:hypothetical protein [Spirochaetota bacterium]